jgi:hypothetical protein
MASVTAVIFNVFIMRSSPLRIVIAPDYLPGMQAIIGGSLRPGWAGLAAWIDESRGIRRSPRDHSASMSRTFTADASSANGFPGLHFRAGSQIMQMRIILIKASG